MKCIYEVTFTPLCPNNRSTQASEFKCEQAQIYNLIYMAIILVGFDLGHFNHRDGNNFSSVPLIFKGANHIHPLKETLKRNGKP